MNYSAEGSEFNANELVVYLIYIKCFKQKHT